MMTEVQKAIWVSDIPKSLNMNVETRFTAIKGSPMAKYAVGTPCNRIYRFFFTNLLHFPRFCLFLFYKWDIDYLILISSVNSHPPAMPFDNAL